MIPLRSTLAGLDAAVTVAELERVVIAAEAEAGLNVPDARRALSMVELRAGVRFGDLNERLRAAGERLFRVADPVVVLVSRWLADTLRDMTQPDAVELLTDAAAPTSRLDIPGLDEAMRDATDAGVHVLLDLWRESAEAVKGEAASQGGNTPSRTTQPDAESLQVMQASVQAVVVEAVARVLRVALDAARRAT